MTGDVFPITRNVLKLTETEIKQDIAMKVCTYKNELDLEPFPIHYYRSSKDIVQDGFIMLTSTCGVYLKANTFC